MPRLFYIGDHPALTMRGLGNRKNELVNEAIASSGVEVYEGTVALVRRLHEQGVGAALDGIDLEIRPGEVVGLVGESGCGKSITALAIMDLLPKKATLKADKLDLQGRNLLTLGKQELRAPCLVDLGATLRDSAETMKVLMQVLGAEVVAVCDRVPERLNRLAQRGFCLRIE